MSYVAYALKWRPKTFDEIIGQNHIVTPLKNALTSSRLSHAYLFAGPRGVGKTSTARILAKSLNCKEGPTLNPCQKCPACIEISQSRSFDVIEIDGASNRGIDEIRTLRENVKFAPTQGRFKVYIIDEVHMLTTEAFNALLKTLEEPPPFVKFIFATTQPHKVIPTILSRCQRFDFRRIPLLEIIAQLERILKAEKAALSRDVLLAIAKSSDGSLRDAESILDQVVSISGGDTSLQDVFALLGMVEQEALFSITDTIIRKDPMASLEMFNNIIESGKDAGMFLSNLIEHFRNLLIAKITRADSQLIDLPRDICERLEQQSKSFSLEELFSAFTLLVNTQEMMKRLQSQRIPFEIGLVRLASDKKSVGAHSSHNPGVHIAKPQPEPHSQAQPQSEPHSQAQPQPKPQPQPLVDHKLIKLQELLGSWESVIDGLKTIKMSVATYLSEASPESIANNVLTISFPQNYSLHREALERKDNKSVIEKYLSETFKSSIKIKFIESDKRAPQETNEHDEFIQSVLNTFKGRVINKE